MPASISVTIMLPHGLMKRTPPEGGGNACFYWVYEVEAGGGIEPPYEDLQSSA
jgi:hypothetical protein